MGVLVVAVGGGGIIAVVFNKEAEHEAKPKLPCCRDKLFHDIV